MVWGYKAVHKSCQCCSSPQSLAKGPGGRELGFSWASRVWSGMNFPEVYTSVQQERGAVVNQARLSWGTLTWGVHEALSSPVPRPISRPPLLSGTTLTFSVLCVLSHVWLFATPWTVARQAPLSMGILQARILEWVAMPFSRGSSQPRSPALRQILPCLSHQGNR